MNKSGGPSKNGIQTLQATLAKEKQAAAGQSRSQALTQEVSLNQLTQALESVK